MDRLEAVIKDVRTFVAERDWQQFHDPKNLAMALASEAGELLAEYRWVSSVEADEFTKSKEVRNRVAAEAADIGVALFLFCDRVGIDLLMAISEKLKTNQKNYPVASSRGKPDRLK